MTLVETVTSDNGDGSTYTHQPDISDGEWEQAEPPSGRIFGLPIAYESVNGKTSKQRLDRAVLAQTIIGSIIVSAGAIAGIGLFALVIAALTLPLWR